MAAPEGTMVVCIAVAEDADQDTVANYVAYVATQIREGFTSGHVDATSYWSIETEE